MTALTIDSFFYNALRSSASVMDATSGRIFNPARPEIDEEEDLVPYIIISNEGVQNDQGTKDDSFESDYDTATVKVLICADDRETLGELSELVRDTIVEYARQEEEDPMQIGSGLTGYHFSSGPVQFDAMKPCCFVEFSYSCETYNQK